MVVVAAMMRETAHGAGSITAEGEESHTPGVIAVFAQRKTGMTRKG
jgi:hypothetical protein